MSVYISGMELPSDENETIIKIQPDGTILDQYGHHLAITATLVPPHGRLIDADAAIANRDTDMNWCYDLYDLPDYLADCPTIIPADPPVIYYPQVPGITPTIISDKEEER